VAVVSELIDVYLTDRRKRGDLCADRARSDRCALHSFARHVGNRQLTNIGAVHVEGWLGSIGHLAPATRRTRLSTVRSLFAWAIRRGHCKRNPATEVRGPVQPRALPRALPAEQIGAVLDACPDARARLIVTLMVQQGLRCCEVSRLEVGHFDMHGLTMLVIGKGHHERLLPLTDETVSALREYLHEWPASAGPLIRSYRRCQQSLRADTISGLVAQWMWDAGIKRKARDGISAHAGRHTCATDMLRGGAHLRDVQAVLGHRHLHTTEVYLPYVVHGLAEALGGRTYRCP
jgi:site-specific recombinase XerD